MITAAGLGYKSTLSRWEHSWKLKWDSDINCSKFKLAPVSSSEYQQFKKMNNQAKPAMKLTNANVIESRFTLTLSLQSVLRILANPVTHIRVSMRQLSGASQILQVTELSHSKWVKLNYNKTLTPSVTPKETRHLFNRYLLLSLL